MGHVTHHAIIVTTYNDDMLRAARAEARRIFGEWTGDSRPEMVSTSFGSVTNGFGTFVVGPDGSKSGWDDDRIGDELRDAFKAWLRAQRYDDGSSPLEWVEVAYGSDDARGFHVSPSISDHEWVDPS